MKKGKPAVHITFLNGNEMMRVYDSIPKASNGFIYYSGQSGRRIGVARVHSYLNYKGENYDTRSNA